MSPKATIYTIFLPCYAWPRGRWQGDELLDKLQARLADVRFVGLDQFSGIMSTEGRAQAYQHITELRDELDGILVFGGYLDRELVSFDLPVIMVRSIFGVGDWEKGLLSFYRNDRLITACLSEHDLSESVATSRFEDLIAKIRLMVAIRRLKDARLLVLQEPEILGSYDIVGMDFHAPLPKDYDEVYATRLAEYGPEIVHKSLVELNEKERQVGEQEATEVVRKWIEDAQAVKETTADEVLQAARLYVAIQAMMDEYHADGVAVRSLVPWVNGLLKVTPCLANTELNRQLRTGVCEGLVNSAITEMLGLYALGRPSFIGDVVGIDSVHDAVTFAHCQCPINPHGTDTVPYVLRSHALQERNEALPEGYPEAAANPGAAVQVLLPTDEPVTSVKLSLYDRKMAIATGTSVRGDSFYQDFDDILCRTKLVMRTNVDAFEAKYDTVRFGVHRNLIYGDQREALKDLAKLLGFEVVEEDR
ncbi:MAG: hypothetical protein ACP5G7_05570 [Anaerolineae bacterium]